jgi:glycosyltransferase involved in cell wall biosynthesis
LSRAKRAQLISFLDQITVLILTFNEEANIGRTLDALSCFSDVVVLDSGSTDATLEIIARYPNVRYATRPFDTHAVQWTYGLTECGIARPWVLALDADYVISAELADEIAALSPGAAISGYLAGFRYCILGRPLRAALYPPVIALYRRERTEYIQQGHTQRTVVDGEVGRLHGRIDHDDRKPLSRWLASQQKYAKLEADRLLCGSHAGSGRSARIRRMGWPAPMAVFLYTLLWKRCIFDGWPGWVYVLQRTLAEIMIALEILDWRLRHDRE